MKPSLEEIQAAFFAAMTEGYARSEKKTSVIQLPGSRMIPHSHGDFQVSDIWFTTPHSDASGGITVISHHGYCVWMMHYGGFYPSSAIPFLKKCLRRAYTEEKRFYGGRGPLEVKELPDESGRGLLYLNRWEGAFSNFSGDETIYDEERRVVGHHWFRGQSMLEDRPPVVLNVHATAMSAVD